jgi:hypothetical protein
MRTYRVRHDGGETITVIAKNGYEAKGCATRMIWITTGWPARVKVICDRGQVRHCPFKERPAARERRVARKYKSEIRSASFS